ncbi:MAG TPA: 3-deoxy-manno-octulosonate cytidylyltransferase [Chitinophagaceae bacterium]|jgi:3-deoxy-manno-octulosonate cytidylyltransferase (CMP-KDO synthetase)|nr:3-deoxy-manno-octulosonate cytidylyltransferase [Chitinophagaceae bacterium]
MKKMALIPARYAASRFPAKLMQDLGGRTVIATTYTAVQSTGLFDEVVVATDSEMIQAEIEGIGGTVFRSRRPHESGTDRIAEAVEQLEADLVVNVQGDTPFIRKEPLEKIVRLFDDPSVQVGSLMQPIGIPEQVDNPNVVKVVTDTRGNALYFSRSPLPFRRDADVEVLYYEHIGVYAFRKEALMRFTQLPPSRLEQIEKLEQLRLLEAGISIRMAETGYIGVAIDTPEDLERARALINGSR